MSTPELLAMLPAPPRVPGHVLVVGAGGIGCPAAWALVGAGVERVTIVDPDEVELSNLPRQVLYVPDDVGLSKAQAAAERLGSESRGVRGVHARLDGLNADALLEGVDLVLDATDGASVKDWLNQLCVRRGVGLVHAAGLRSEARLLSVGVGGRPCLACLFGRLEDESGSCADLGVWNGVVGVVGFLAAAVAVARLTGAADESGYRVLDFESGHAFTLGAEPDDACPVCAAVGGAVEAYPGTVGCAVPSHARRDVAAADRTLDLEDERCPMNLLRSRQALEAADPGTLIEIRLGEEGAETVPDGVRALGHRVLRATPWGDGVRIVVEAGATTGTSTFDDETLRRFARQVVLPDVGEAGQRRLFDAAVLVLGRGAATASAAVYLAAAGVGRVALPDAPSSVVVAVDERARGRTARDGAGAWDVAIELDGSPHAAARSRVGVVSGDGGFEIVWDADHLTAEPELDVPSALALGALLADAVERALVAGEPRPSFAIAPAGFRTSPRRS